MVNVLKSTIQDRGEIKTYPTLVPIQAADVGSDPKDRYQVKAARHANDSFILFGRTRNKEKKKF
jgi:transcriptional regulator of met regulon